MDNVTYEDISLSEGVPVLYLENVISQCNVGDLVVFGDANGNFDFETAKDEIKLEPAEETPITTKLFGICSDKSKQIKVKKSKKCWRQKEVVIKTLESQFTVFMWSLEDDEEHEEKCASEMQIKSEDDDEHEEKFASERQIKSKADNNNAIKLRRSCKKVTRTRQSPLQLPCTFGTCKKIFTHASALRKHWITHKERTFVCPECGKAFVERSKLCRHNLVHSGEKPFACYFEGCGKRFSLDFNLRTHVRIHTGFRPYACPMDGCRKSFAQSTNLKSHIKTHKK